MPEAIKVTDRPWAEHATIVRRIKAGSVSQIIVMLAKMACKTPVHSERKRVGY